MPIPQSSCACLTGEGDARALLPAGLDRDLKRLLHLQRAEQGIII